MVKNNFIPFISIRQVILLMRKTKPIKIFFIHFPLRTERILKTSIWYKSSNKNTNKKETLTHRYDHISSFLLDPINLPWTCWTRKTKCLQNTTGISLIILLKDVRVGKKKSKDAEYSVFLVAFFIGMASWSEDFSKNSSGFTTN